MNFVQELQGKRDFKIVELAEQFMDVIKPELIEAAENGCSSYDYKFETNTDEEIQKMQIYTSKVFVEYLNKIFGGVVVKNNQFLNFSQCELSLKFTW